MYRNRARRAVVETTAGPGPTSCLRDDVKRCVVIWLLGSCHRLLGPKYFSACVAPHILYYTVSSCCWLYVLIDLFMMIWPSRTTIIFLHRQMTSAWCFFLCRVISFFFFSFLFLRLFFAMTKFLFAFHFDLFCCFCCFVFICAFFLAVWNAAYV